jgi:hypothetical protein
LPNSGPNFSASLDFSNCLTMTEIGLLNSVAASWTVFQVSVTLILELATVFKPFFPSLADSCALSKIASPLFSSGSALFEQDTQVGGIPIARDAH